MAKIVFDMGATNTRVARVENGKLGKVSKTSTPKNVDERVRHLLSLIDEAEKIVGGVAGAEARERMAATLPHARVYNDALMAGLGEAVYGAGKDKEIVGYIGLGTGIGTARISGKKIDAVGFEAGHHLIGEEVWEEKVSGRVLTEKHGEYPQKLDRKIYDDYIRAVAMGVYNAILFWSPDVLVMGGSLVNEKEGFKVEEIAAATEGINEALATLPPIVKSELGDNAGLYGAMAIIENEVKAR
jgi:predicted NBD/HSP70 family sugar kinase